MAPGRFIVFEGLDGAGTSTQIALLGAWLTEKGIDNEVTREPTAGPIGRLIREVLGGVVDLDPASLALLFAADRVNHLDGSEGIKTTLAAGRWALSDRYVLSSLAYQAADGLDPEWVRSINGEAITPDLTVFVDTDPLICMQRIEARGGKRERFENLERQQAVLEQFRWHLSRTELTGRLVEVSGNGSREEVAAAIQAAIQTYVEG